MVIGLILPSLLVTASYLRSVFSPAVSADIGHPSSAATQNSSTSSLTRDHRNSRDEDIERVKGGVVTRMWILGAREIEMNGIRLRLLHQIWQRVVTWVRAPRWFGLLRIFRYV